MTPDSVLKAMAEALAKKFTYTPEGAKQERPLEERVHDGMAVGYPTGGYLGTSMRPVTAKEAAVEAMTVVGPILEMFFRLKEAARELAESHKDFIEDWITPHECDPHTLEVQYVMESLLGQIEVKEPADWSYVSRFSATPNEIHNILREGLHPNVHLAYQRALARPILRQVAEGIRKTCDDSYTQEELLFNPVLKALYEVGSRCADMADPDKGGKDLPDEVVTPEG